MTPVLRAVQRPLPHLRQQRAATCCAYTAAVGPGLQGSRLQGDAAAVDLTAGEAACRQLLHQLQACQMLRPEPRLGPPTALQEELVMHVPHACFGLAFGGDAA